MNASDQKFSREIKKARKQFTVEHGNYPPWDAEISDPVGTFVIKSGGIDAHEYVTESDALRIDGMGEIDGTDVLVAEVRR